MGNNKLIILNGTSSSGKTTLASTFVELTNDCFYNFSMDSILSFLPRKYRIFRNHNEVKPECAYILTEENKKGFYFDSRHETIQMGECAKNIYNDNWAILKTLMSEGRNIIFDYIFFNINEFKENAKMLLDFNVYIVRLFCNIEELRRRESSRGDRLIGSAEKSIKFIDTQYNDLVLDTTNKTPTELAEELNDFILNNPPRVFRELYKNNT